jgi:hypothetical protein
MYAAMEHQRSVLLFPPGWEGPVSAGSRPRCRTERVLTAAFDGLVRAECLAQASDTPEAEKQVPRTERGHESSTYGN